LIKNQDKVLPKDGQMLNQELLKTTIFSTDQIHLLPKLKMLIST